MNPDWQIGDVILELYEIVSLLGEGGMGRVYKVYHKDWNLALAVKSPRIDIFTQKNGKENFVREAETWINLGIHPHIVSCYYVRTIGDIPRVFAEYIEGGSLADWIRQHRLYEGGRERALERMLDVAIQFARGLDYAHEQGLVHQDVKPANVMITLDGVAKVTDFGLAKARTLAGEVSTAQDGQSILVSSGGRTPAYCSPEQGTGKPLNRKTDIWSWGLSILEMFVGEVTWMAGQAAEAALTGYLDTGTSVPVIPSMPKPLAELLQRCFQKEPSARPASMSVVADELQLIYQQVTGKPFTRPVPKAAELIADGLNNRAVSLLDLGNAEEAGRRWEEALRVDPRHLETIYNWGVVRWRRGEITDERLVQQMDEANSPHNAGWLKSYLLGQIHAERKDIEQAVIQLQKAVQRSAPEVEAKTLLQLIRSKRLPAIHHVRTFEGHKAFVSSVSLFRNTDLALSGSYDETLRLWDVATGKCIRIFEGHKDAVTSISINEDERFVLSGGGRGDKTLRLWEISSGKCIYVIEGFPHEITSVCLSCNPHLAISGSPGGGLDLWEFTTKKRLRSFEGHLSQVNDISLSPDNRFLISACGGHFDKTLKLWDIATGDCVRTFEGHTDPPLCVHMSGDGTLAVSGSMDRTLRLWDVTTGECLRIFRGHEDNICSVYLSRDNLWVLSCGEDRTIRLWEVATGRCLRTIQGHLGSVFSISVSGDEHFVLSGSGDGTLRLWTIDFKVSNLCTLRLSRLRSYTELSQAELQLSRKLDQTEKELLEGNFTSALAHAREARQVVGQEQSPKSQEMWNRLALVSQRVGIGGAWLAHKYYGHSDGVVCGCISTDGQWILSGSGDHTLRLWELMTGKCLRVLEGHDFTVSCVCFSKDNRWALSGSAEDASTIRLWDLTTGECLRTFKGHTNVVSSVCFSSDGQWALSGSYDGTLRMWHISTGNCLRTLKGHTLDVLAVCLSQDNRWAISASEDKTLKLWDLVEGQCVYMLEGHTASVRCVSLSVNNRIAVSGSIDGTLRLWDIETGKCLNVFGGSRGIVLAVSLSADGRFALSSYERYSEIDLWDVNTGECLYTFKGHNFTVPFVNFSPDQRFVLTGGSLDRALHLWELDWELEAHDPADWDDGALPYLQDFLTLHTPFVGTLPQDCEPSEEGIRQTLTRRGVPSWNEQDFQELIHQLQYSGFGWLRPEGIKQQLEYMAQEWQVPIPLNRLIPQASNLPEPPDFILPSDLRKWSDAVKSTDAKAKASDKKGLFSRIFKWFNRKEQN